MKKYVKADAEGRTQYMLDEITSSTISDNVDVLLGECGRLVQLIRKNIPNDFNDTQTERILDNIKHNLADIARFMDIDVRGIRGATDPDATYVNKKNPNKFIEIKKYKDGNQVARQYMKWDTPEGEVKNYTGAKDAKRGRYFRTRKDTLNQMLEDYDEVESATALDSRYGEREIEEILPPDTATAMYIDIAETYPEYYEYEGIAAHVFFDDGTANFWQDSKGVWRLGIYDESQYDEETYQYGGKFWCTDELDAAEMNDIKLTPKQLYAELSKLPGVDLNYLYGLREIFSDFEVEFSPWM